MHRRGRNVSTRRAAAAASTSECVGRPTSSVRAEHRSQTSPPAHMAPHLPTRAWWAAPAAARGGAGPRALRTERACTPVTFLAGTYATAHARTTRPQRLRRVRPRPGRPAPHAPQWTVHLGRASPRALPRPTAPPQCRLRGTHRRQRRLRLQHRHEEVRVEAPTFLNGRYPGHRGNAPDACLSASLSNALALPVRPVVNAVHRQ